MNNASLPEESLTPLPAPAVAAHIQERVEHRYTENEAVRIHYTTVRAGPLILMLHGFPDYWYTWRYQMATLSQDYRVAAPDLRGYNLSDKPKGIEHYGMRAFLGDVRAMVQEEGYERAIIIGHDWGGAIAWQFATRLPEMTGRLAILNLPHLSGLTRELANPEQQKSSQYTRDFQEEDLNGTWEWVDSDLTLATIPEAGHFVQQDAADLVARVIGTWLSC